MNPQHLWAFLWLRWRLRVNQLRRGGVVNAVFLAIMGGTCLVLAGILFVVALVAGLFAFTEASPAVLMYVWDALALAFLFFWTTGLITELQRSEALSLDKFLHLPVSLSSAFLINYFSSLLSVSLLLFVPPMLGLSLGLVFRRGLAMLLLVPMLAAFLLMITALTYQFQGWLATLMANPRRRRTVIVLATMVFILLCQAPNLVNLLRPWERLNPPQVPDVQTAEQRELMRALAHNEITPEEYQKRQVEVYKRQLQITREAQARSQRDGEAAVERVERTVWLVNLCLPPGWLPVGVEGVAAGRPWPIVLALVGPTLIGTASLWRAYRTTLRLYTGQFTTGKDQVVVAVVRTSKPSSPLLLERRLPWLSEQAQIVALGMFRSLLRAPEAKMLLLTPFFMLVIFGSMFLVTGHAEVPEAARSLMAFGAMVMLLFSMAHLIGNQFGFDRNGFRVFVLSPAPRRDILLGKNLSVAPLTLLLGTMAAVFMQVVYPQRLDHFLALAPRFVSMYLLYCMLANVLSILAPMRIAAGSLQPAQPGGIILLWHLLFMSVCPFVLALTLIPLGLEWTCQEMGWLPGLPLDLLLSLLECAVVVVLYRFILRGQGAWLQAREQRILQIVTTRAE